MCKRAFKVALLKLTFQAPWRSARDTGPDPHREPEIAVPSCVDVVSLRHFRPRAKHWKAIPSNNVEPEKKSKHLRTSPLSLKSGMSNSKHGAGRTVSS